MDVIDVHGRVHSPARPTDEETRRLRNTVTVGQLIGQLSLRECPARELRNQSDRGKRESLPWAHYRALKIPLSIA